MHTCFRLLTLFSHNYNSSGGWCYGRISGFRIYDISRGRQHHADTKPIASIVMVYLCGCRICHLYFTLGHLRFEWVPQGGAWLWFFGKGFTQER